jgi:hypothetical protein
MDVYIQVMPLQWKVSTAGWCNPLKSSELLTGDGKPVESPILPSE